MPTEQEISPYADEIRFRVLGTPQSRGSKRAFAFKRKGIPLGQPRALGVRVTDDNPKSQAWMDCVAYEARRAMAGRPILIGPVEVTAIFVMRRPKGHYGTGRNAAQLKASAPRYHTTKPDRGKLVRAVEDALTGIVYRDDAAVCDGPVRKIYGESAHAEIIIRPLEKSNSGLQQNAEKRSHP